VSRYKECRVADGETELLRVLGLLTANLYTTWLALCLRWRSQVLRHDSPTFNHSRLASPFPIHHHTFPNLILISLNTGSIKYPPPIQRSRRALPSFLLSICIPLFPPSIIFRALISKRKWRLFRVVLAKGSRLDPLLHVSRRDVGDRRVGAFTWPLGTITG